MGKRKSDSGNGNKNKKYKVSGFIDPNTTGVYATCNRGRELGCRKELVRLLSEKIEKLYPDWENHVEDEEAQEEDNDKKTEETEATKEPKELSVEEKIQEELESMKGTKGRRKAVHPLLQPMELGCECLVFVKVRKPAVPVELVHALCEEASITKQKNTKFTQKLTPITFSVSASMEELTKLAEKVLKPHFHAEDQEPVTFAIQVTRRNFNTLEKEDIIKHVASIVGRENNHKVDLKNFDKLIMIECFKNNIGMSVVSDFRKFEKFNLQQIFEKDMGESTLSRVSNSK
ncbi:hypothetical protein JCM33374_g702 [Metschnikowia sp. JCM 33374]|nr:hypothetical protein JCM33374_g702 [Metschnikowia sp. JCM 33374]